MLVRKPFSALVPTPQQDVTLFCILTQPGPASETSDLEASISSEGGTAERTRVQADLAAARRRSAKTLPPGQGDHQAGVGPGCDSAQGRQR